MDVLINSIVSTVLQLSLIHSLVASDIIISDYSGCAFDFPMIGKPGFLYAEDYEEMKRTKDYYFQLEDLPFTLALTLSLIHI